MSHRYAKLMEDHPSLPGCTRELAQALCAEIDVFQEREDRRGAGLPDRSRVEMAQRKKIGHLEDTLAGKRRMIQDLRNEKKEITGHRAVKTMSGKLKVAAARAEELEAEVKALKLDRARLIEEGYWETTPGEWSFQVGAQ